MAEPVHARRFSAGVVVVHLGAAAAAQYLLLRAYKNWDFPKGLVEPGEQPLEAAVREVKEETTLANLFFDWGQAYMDTGPYNKGKISRYYLARSNETQVHLPINPELGFPEHQEARWVGFRNRAQHGLAAAQAGDSLGERKSWARRRPARPPPLESNAAAADLEHIAADKNLRLAVHVEKQRRRPGDEFSL